MSSTSPLSGWNAALRFGLEIAALVALAGLGWTLGTGASRVLAVVIPVGAAVLWGRYRVPNDPGPAPVAIPGRTRLILELIVFAAGFVARLVAFGSTAAYVYLGLLVVHHIAARERIDWLLQR